MSSRPPPYPNSTPVTSGSETDFPEVLARRLRDSGHTISTATQCPGTKQVGSSHDITRTATTAVSVSLVVSYDAVNANFFPNTRADGSMAQDGSRLPSSENSESKSAQ